MKDVLVRYNPWWSTGKVEEKKIGKPRKFYIENVLPFLEKREIIKLSGVRRSGKSTIMFQLIQHLLGKGVNPKSILYVQLDDEELALYDKGVLLKRIIEEYQQLCGINIQKSKTYIFFDEIQYIDRWESWLKTYYDNYPDIKFVVSGSTSTLLEKKSVEKLSGRQIDFTVFPLLFHEFAQFNGIDIESKGFPPSDIKDLENDIKILSKKQDIKILLNKYLEKGGFPRMIFEDEEESKALLKQYFKDILYRDIVKVFEIRDVEALENLAIYLLNHISQKFNFKSIASLLKITTDTAIEYYKLLEKSYLLYAIKYYSGSMKSSIRKDKKVYCIDTGLRNAIVSGGKEGDMAENAVFSHMRAKTDKIYYWSNSKECDFIAVIGGDAFPIEVKYQNQITEEDMEGVIGFMEKFSLNKGFIVTKDLLEERTIGNKKIFFIPLYLFLLL